MAAEKFSSDAYDLAGLWLGTWDFSGYNCDLPLCGCVLVHPVSRGSCCVC